MQYIPLLRWTIHIFLVNSLCILVPCRLVPIVFGNYCFLIEKIAWKLDKILVVGIFRVRFDIHHLIDRP